VEALGNCPVCPPPKSGPGGRQAERRSVTNAGSVMLGSEVRGLTDLCKAACENLHNSVVGESMMGQWASRVLPTGGLCGPSHTADPFHQ